MWDGFDQRRFPRMNVKCEITIGQKPNQKTVVTKTENIGVGGVCVIQNLLSERFNFCHIKLVLEKNKEFIECQGKVCWLIPCKNPKQEAGSFYDTGVEFINLPSRDQNRLDQFIQSKMKQGFKDIC